MGARATYRVRKIWKIYCDDHSSLSSTIAVQIWIISYMLQKKSVQRNIIEPPNPLRK